MKREIRFRGKSVKTGEWLYGYLQEYQERHVKRLCVCAASVRTWTDALLYEVVPDTVGQFTGLQDVNGKEIYEGDIVLCKGKHSYVVQWISDGFAMRGITYKGIASVMAFLPIEMEVIGNVFDNPDLLAESETKNEG